MPVWGGWGVGGQEGDYLAFVPWPAEVPVEQGHWGKEGAQ